MEQEFSHPRLPSEILDLYPPDRDELFALLRAKISDASLRRIARNDSVVDFEANWKALIGLRDGVGIHQSLAFEPHEVLAITCWEDWDEETDLVAAHSFHIERAFAGAALIQADDDFAGSGFLAPLLRSCLELTKSFIVPLGRLISWHTQCVCERMEFGDYADEELLFDSIGLLVVLLHDDRVGAEITSRYGDWLISTHGSVLAECKKPEPWKMETESELSAIHDFLYFSPIGYTRIRWVHLVDQARHIVAHPSALRSFLDAIWEDTERTLDEQGFKLESRFAQMNGSEGSA